MRSIFERYLELGSVHALERDLASRGIRTRETQRRDGSIRGGVAFSRGALFHLLRNRLYRGEIPHKGQTYPGQHKAIVSEALFEAVQARLDGQTQRRSASGDQRVANSPLTGRIFDADGHPMSPSFAYGQHGTLYRYYVSSPLQQGQRRPPDDPHPRRVPAQLLEETLVKAMTGSLDMADAGDSALLDQIGTVKVEAGRLIVSLHPDPRNPTIDSLQPLIIPFRLSTRNGRTEIVAGDTRRPRRDPVLIRALKQAHARLGRDEAGQPTLDSAPDMIRARRMLRLAFLAPDLQRAILEGRQPREITLARLIDSDIPLLWSEQRQLFAAAG